MNIAKKTNGIVIITRTASIVVIASGGTVTPINGRIGIGNIATNHNIPKPANLFHFPFNRLTSTFRIYPNLSITLSLCFLLS